MAYEIYRLTDGDEILDIWGIICTISMRKVKCGNRATIEQTIADLGLQGFSVDCPTAVVDYRAWNLFDFMSGLVEEARRQL